MLTTIDSGGRIVIPKDIRDEIGLHPGDQVNVELRGSVVHVALAQTESRLVDEAGLLVIPNAGAALSDADVRRLRLDVQR